MKILKEILKPLGKRSLHACLIACSSTTNNDFAHLKNKRLFKVPRVKNFANENETIALERAIAEFNLKEDDLRGLKEAPHDLLKQKFYFTNDVYNRAVQIHGNSEGIIQSRERAKDPYTSSRIEQIISRIHDEEKINETSQRQTSSLTESGDWTVLVALTTNILDTASKFIGYCLTGSLSLLSECFHSGCDTFNTFILFIANLISKRKPDEIYPYGLGNARYIASAGAGVFLFLAGGCYSTYQGIQGIMYPVELELSYAPIFLIISCCLQGVSAFNAYREAFKQLPDVQMPLYKKIKFVFSINDPTHRVVLVEDTAAIAGFLIAGACVSMSMYFQTPFFDSLGSVLIGSLLCGVAYGVVKTNMQQLMNKSVPTELVRKIIENDPVVAAVSDIKGTRIDVDSSRLKAEIRWNGRAITERYLRDKSLDEMFHKVKEMDSIDQFKEFMLNHGENIVERVGDENDRIEGIIKKKHPEFKYIDFESD